MRTGMRCAFAFMVMVMIAGAASVSSAEQQPYARLSGVLVLPTTSDVSGTDRGEVDLDSTVGIVGAVGTRQDQGRDAWEQEAELGYRSMSLGNANLSSVGAVVFINSDISTVTIMGNLRYVFRHQDQFHPYVGVGLGTAIHTIDFNGFKYNSTALAYQFMAGLAYAVSKQMEMQAGFRYVGTTEAEVERFREMYTYQTYGFEFGATFLF